VTLKLVIHGAGAVGLVVGARLARAGSDVLFVTKRPEQARRIRREGVRLEDPASGDAWQVRPRAVAGVEDAREALCEGPVILCVRAPQVDAATEPLARVAPAVTIVGAQNGVDTDALLASRFPSLIGLVVRQTCTRKGDAAARAAGAGRLILGAHPRGAGAEVEALAEALRAAGYDVGISQQIGEDRWLKLCVNLMSAPNALIHREDHTTRAFVEIKVRLLEEARAVLAAAGIEARSCDGRDRSLAEEITYQRHALALGTNTRPLPLYNQVWSALRHGGPLEADDYHRRILELAATHQVPAPLNARVLEILERCDREKKGPESVRASEILDV
jgi:2-dehydropantoate 2-reductase